MIFCTANGHPDGHIEFTNRIQCGHNGGGLGTQTLEDNEVNTVFDQYLRLIFEIGCQLFVCVSNTEVAKIRH